MKPTVLDTEFYKQYIRRGYGKSSPDAKIQHSMRVTDFWEDDDVPYELAVASFLACGKIRDHGDVLTPCQLQDVREILTDCWEDEDIIDAVLRILGGSPDCTEEERKCRWLLSDTVLYHHIINHSPYTEWAQQAEKLRSPEVQRRLLAYAEKERRKAEEQLKQKKETGIIRPEFVETACHTFLKWKAGCALEPAALWQNLQKFAACPIDADEDDLLWEVYPKRNAYCIAFVRQYSQPDGDEYLQLHIECTLPSGKPLRRETLWSFDCPSREDFFARIEQSPAFRAFLAQNSVSPKIHIDET